MELYQKPQALSMPILADIQEECCPRCMTSFYPEPYPEWKLRYCSERCQKFDNRFNNPDGYLKHCNVPSRYLNCDFNNFNVDAGNKTAFSKLHELNEVKDIIYITGDVGTGKTHLSVALLRNLRHLQYQKGNFQPATRILLELRSGFSNDKVSEKDALRTYQLDEILIVDDLGAEKLTDYVVQAWYSIVDYRYSNMLPTVITSNLSIQELAAKFGDRIASRAASGMVLTLKGSDRRIEKWNKGGR